MTWTDEVYGVGSSPRVRGTDSRVAIVALRPRFIPARAGNGLLLGLSSNRCKVHPRACGERAYEFFSRSLADGSSPRVRGTDRKAHRPAAHRRFIPARAGNGSLQLRRGRRLAVHPRACGERSSMRWLFAP